MAEPSSTDLVRQDGDGANSSLAIVVGTLDRIEQLKALVGSIRRNVRTPWELHISDAGSTDGTRDWLIRESDTDTRINSVFEKKRSGQAAALNAVFETISADYTCWLSDDNVVVGDGVDIAIAALADDEQLGMVGLKVKDKRGPFADAAYIGGITSTGIINVNQGILRTSLLRQLGGFNMKFRDYGIDADLTTRVLLAGRDVALTRAVAIEHFRNWPEPETPEAERHEERNVRYRACYDQLYKRKLGTDPIWMAKRSVWKMFRLAAPHRLSPEKNGSIFGRPVRDWHNMLAGRFVSTSAELANVTSLLHLRQRAPRGRD